MAWANFAAGLGRFANAVPQLLFPGLGSGGVDPAVAQQLRSQALMQMGANDSSTLIDSPVASRLGAERALLFSEERGTIERFRPFEPVEAAALAAIVSA